MCPPGLSPPCLPIYFIFANFADRHLGVDQTTRSSERWTLLAPVLEEQYDVTDHMNYFHHQDMRKFIKDDFTWDAFDKLGKILFDTMSTVKVWDNYRNLRQPALHCTSA